MFRSCADVVRAPVQPVKCKESTSKEHCTFKCEFCYLGWASETELLYHKRSHFLKYPKKEDHFCWQCITKYKTKNELITHLKTNHLLSSKDARCVEREIFICDSCECVFFNKKMLMHHIVHQHRELNLTNQHFHCPKCMKQKRADNIWAHLNYHCMVGMYTCPICFVKCENRPDQLSHLESHPLYLYCSICNENFDKLAMYSKHFEKHKPFNEHICKDNVNEQEEIPEYIQRCFVPKEHKSLAKTKRRTRFNHKIQPSINGLKLQKELKICILCRQMCTTYEQMKEHILYHHTPPEKSKDIILENKFVCSCGQMFPQRILLKQHFLKNKGSAHEELSVGDINNLLGDSTTDMEGSVNEFIIFNFSTDDPRNDYNNV